MWYDVGVQGKCESWPGYCGQNAPMCTALLFGACLHVSAQQLYWESLPVFHWQRACLGQATIFYELVQTLLQVHLLCLTTSSDCLALQHYGSLLLRRLRSL